MENENYKKETTVPDTSVGADDGQPLHNSTENSISAFDEEINGDFQNNSESLDEIYRRMQRLTDPHYLHTISMTELYQTAYQSRPPIIDGLLYAGAYILAGAPKIGKSFLVAQIAYHVSTGKALWDYEVHPGTVLYLALEDDFQRIQSRMFMMYGVNDTDRLRFATAAGKIGNGLDEQLENFVCEHPDTKLIIIDTMQKIREVGGEAYSYASDYEIIGRLKQFADKHCICVLTVHHTRKQPAGDSFEMISGTTVRGNHRRGGARPAGSDSLSEKGCRHTDLESRKGGKRTAQRATRSYSGSCLWSGVRRTAGMDRLSLRACRCCFCRHGGKCTEQVSECEVRQAAG